MTKNQKPDLAVEAFRTGKQWLLTTASPDGTRKVQADGPFDNGDEAWAEAVSAAAESGDASYRAELRECWQAQVVLDGNVLFLGDVDDHPSQREAEQQGHNALAKLTGALVE